MDVLMKNTRIVRRIINNIRILEHATCTAGGALIGLEDDISKLAEKYGYENPLENELKELRELSCQISDAAADLHNKMGDLAEEHEIEIPTHRLVNTGGGSNKSDP